MSRVTLHVWEPDPGEGEICDKPGMKTMRRTMEHILLYTQKKTASSDAVYFRMAETVGFEPTSPRGAT